MTTEAVKRAWRLAYPDGDRGNFMTPNVLRRGERGEFVYELSEGRGMSGQPIYGVTVVTRDGVIRDDLSRCCFSLVEAEALIADRFKPAERAGL